ncbi:hypothetical protein BCV71DRAFT_277353 [Rhizopus microsporus]|uniref:Uncharacterized protein n=1 Tax=Rhizopus microsporus TaxID=58291 RepID=A0A1X0RNY9_RHIZD|nr:hypothetical protein BCV71DRAFT_277353 [Rhizopus microsporus]
MPLLNSRLSHFSSVSFFWLSQSMRVSITLELFGDNESIVILGNYDLNNALGTLTDNLSSSIASSNKIIVKNANFQSHGWLLIIKPLFYQYLYPESTYPLGIIFHLYLHQLFYL